MNDQIRVLRPYLRGLPIIILSMIAGLLLAKKYLAYTTPMYESTTKIKLADLKEGVTGNNLFKDLDVFSSTNKIAMEIEVLKSQVLIEKALIGLDFEEELSRIGKVKTLEIFNDKPFFHQMTVHHESVYNQNWVVEVTDNFNYNIHIESSDKVYEGVFGDTLDIDGKASLLLLKNEKLLLEKPNLNLIDQYKFVKYSKSKIVEKVLSNLDVVSIDKDVAVLKIIFKSNVPEKAALFTNALAKSYIEDYIEEKFKTADVTADFLDKQIDKVFRELSNAEMQIQNYRVDNDIINIRQETETDLRQISQMRIQKTNVKMSLDAISELNSYIQKGKDNFLDLAPNFEAFTDLLSTEMIKKIKALQSEKTDLTLIYKSDHELVKAVDQKIKYYTDYFIESINNTKKNLETKYNKLSYDIDEAEKVFIGLPERERILSILDRNFQIHQQSYIFLNEKKIEAEIAKAAKHAFHRVIYKATIPQKPVSPNRPIIIIVSTILAMIGAILFIFLVNISKGRVNDMVSVEKLTDIPIIYSAPHFKSQKNIRPYFKNEVFKLDIQHKLVDNTSIVFTSFNKNHGSKFHLQHLAEIFTDEKRNFVLLTFDEEHTFQLPSGNIKVLSETEISTYTFSELEQWYNKLCKMYDLVLVDNFTFADNAKALLFMQMAHENLFVIDTRKTYLKSIGELNIVKAKNQILDLGIVLNNDKYSPSLIKEGLWLIKQIRKLLNRKQ